MAQQLVDDRTSLLMSYFSVRKAIGWTGCALPVVLLLGALLLFDEGLQPSMSAYYYTGMRNVFVGALCSIGLFLLASKGREGETGYEDTITNLAGLCAIGVAFMPTKPLIGATEAQVLVGKGHLIVAGLLLALLGAISYFVFARNTTPTDHAKEASAYRVCGRVIWVCVAVLILLIALEGRLPKGISDVQPVFWLEAIAVMTFGIAWLLRGKEDLGWARRNPLSFLRRG